MKLYKAIFVAFLVALGATGCNKAFLDDPKPTDKVASSDVFKTEAGINAYFNGIYRRMREQWSNNNVVSTTDAWGISSLYLARIAKGDEIIVVGTNWYINDYREDNRDASFRRSRFTWGYLYEFVNHANVIISGVSTTSLNQSIKDKYTAQAKALRAWAYFELIREFQFSYAQNPNAPGVPLYTEPTSTTTVGKPRGTVANVYALILDDLKFAVSKLESGQLNKSNIDLNVASGLLARVYLEMGQWKNAEDAADVALDGYDLDASDYTRSINNVNNSENIWSFGQQADQSIYFGTPSSFWGKFGNGYDTFYINDSFVKKFSATDVRNKFDLYDEDLPTMWGTRKFGDDIDFAEAITMMRVPEMILIKAEAQAMLTNQQAGNTLYDLQVNRDPNAVKSGNTGTNLINEILLERKKELYGENGVEFMDLKRRNLPLVRTGNHATTDKITMLATDKRFVLQIPQGEFDSNSALKPSDQNP